MSPSSNSIELAFKSLQDDICQQLSHYDGSQFREDNWQRQGGGGGRTRVLAGTKIEKGGVNFSAVHGALDALGAKSLGIPVGSFFATGVSIVLHPVNPWVPIMHMNIRYFEAQNGDWWFGGGIDLTPHFISVPDAQFFHQQLKAVCDTLDPVAYATYKTWADNYFYIKHRQETRGIGGIFFDRLGTDTYKSKQILLDFVLAVGNCFAPTYLALAIKNQNRPFGPAEQYWQRLRRGRYAEFNLAIDRGTRFGLETDGRTESILMSLPPMAIWEYDQQPQAGSAEAFTLAHLKKDINWLEFSILPEIDE